MVNKDRLYQEKKKACDWTSLVWTVTVWSKGQIVIPKEAREQLGLVEWTKLMVVIKHGVALGIIKSDDVPQFLEYMNKEMGDQEAVEYESTKVW